MQVPQPGRWPRPRHGQLFVCGNSNSMLVNESTSTPREVRIDRASVAQPPGSQVAFDADSWIQSKATPVMLTRPFDSSPKYVRAELAEVRTTPAACVRVNGVRRSLLKLIGTTAMRRAPVPEPGAAARTWTDEPPSAAVPGWSTRA